MKRVIALCILLGAVLWAVDPWTGDIGPVPWWVMDHTNPGTNLKFRGICVINDSLAWVVGEASHVWERTGNKHSHNWVRRTNLPLGYDDYHFNDVCFVGADTGWIVGEYKHSAGIHDTLKYRGVVYKTTDGGGDWIDVTPTQAAVPLPTPFLKVRFANQNEGYISCGNGIVLKTGDGGATWSRCKTPWNTKDSISVWYNGLGLDPSSSQNLWVSGDAFGIISKSTDGGANWTAYQPDVFKQSYSFPSGTQTPYDPRLANFDMLFTSSSNGRVALSYGKIGKTTNSGSTWDTIRYEPQATWFYDITKDIGGDYFTGGNYGVVHRFDGTDGQEHVNYRWGGDVYGGFDLSLLDVKSLGSSSDSSISYAAGHSCYMPIRQRYLPADFQLDSCWVRSINDTTYEIRIKWHTTFERNTRKWYIYYYINNHLLRIEPFGQYGGFPDSINATPPSGTYEYFDTLSLASGDYKADYYYVITISTKDTLSVPPSGYIQYYRQTCEVCKIDSDSVPNLLPYSPFEPASNLVAVDNPDDEGHCIKLTWNKCPIRPLWYRIGRATDSLGPYYQAMKYYSADSTITCYDSTAQDGINYYYVVMCQKQVASAEYAEFSDYTNIASASSSDTTKPPEIDSLWGSYLQDENLIRLQWIPPSNTPDIAGYWVCPIPPGASDEILNHSSPIEHTIFYVPVDSTWQGWCEFYVAAMDYSGNISDWGGPCSVYVATTIDTSSSATATGYNNGRNMARETNKFWVCYESNGVVYAKRSTDAGKTWLNRMQLGSGYYPSISLNVNSTQILPPGIAWLAQGTNDTIYFSKYISGTSWTTPRAVVTSSNDLGPPSIAIGSDQYCYLSYKDGSIIKYTRFDISKPKPGTPDSVGEGSKPSVGYMPPGSGYPEVHIAWESSSNMQYRAKTLSSGWSSTENIFSNGKRPNLEVVGSVVHVVCDSCSTDIWHCKAEYSASGHTWTTTQVSNTSNNSKYAVITSGSACAWVEELSGNKEVYHSYYDSKTGWSASANISETSEHSNYPHIVHKQTPSETKLYFVWTEGDNSPYDIKFKWSILGGGSKDGPDDPDLPFYVANCGEKQVSGFNLRREGYIQYGKEPYERIDYDSEYLEYEFEMLNPDKEYALEAYLYHKGNNNLPLTIKVDNSQIAQIDLPANELFVHKGMLPSSLYGDGCVNLKIYGNLAVSGILVIYEYDNDEKSPGGPQTQEIIQLNELLFNGIYPNPMKGNKNLKLAFNTLHARKITIKLYDVTGRLTQEVYNGTMKSGQHEILVRTDEMAAGVYFMRIESENDIITEKFILLR